MSPSDVTQSDSRSRRDTDADVRLFTLVVAHHPDPDLLDCAIPMLPGRTRLLGRDSVGWPPGLTTDGRQSRSHVQVSVPRTDDGVDVVDLDSRNGTWVRGQRVSKARLADGDWLTVGDTVFVLRRRAPDHHARPHALLAGISAEHAHLVSGLAAVAPTLSTVCLTGPPGVGKERVARAIHAESGRTGPFIAVNCGALHGAVLQSELFGHVSGAFTGARAARPGLVRAAQGGTLLLDEIGDAPPDVQVALLRLLQERRVRPVGSDREVAVDVRFVAATNRSAAELSARLRPDLRTRLDQWPISVPALSTRIDDIMPMVRSLAPGARLHRSLVERLLGWGWPGNVRELEGIVHRLQATESAPWRVPAWLDALLTERSAPVPISSEDPAMVPERPDAASLQAALDATRGNVQATARQLGVGRSTLYRWMRQLGVRPKRV